MFSSISVFTIHRLASGFPVGIIAAGLILGWLWLRTESIWLVAIGHGALNGWGQYAFRFLKDSVNPAAVSLDLKVLSAGFWALSLVGVFLLWRWGKVAERSVRPYA